MNSTLPDDDPSILYNDSDYPSKDHGPFPENFDAITQAQGIACDVDRYIEIASGVRGPVLEIGCGPAVSASRSRAPVSMSVVSTSPPACLRATTKN